MRLLDLFSGAGGCAVGYNRAGFTEIVGVDNRPQPRYPFKFVQADALEYLARLIQDGEIEKFDLIHASPPCQFGSEATPVFARDRYTNYIPALRAMLLEAGRPYVIENVEAVRKWLRSPTMICGSMLGLPIWRHRYFETWPALLLSPGTCYHVRRPIQVKLGSHSRKTWDPVLCTGGGDGKGRGDRNLYRPRESVGVVRWAMEIPWMTRDELSEAIPPKYTEWIGQQMIELTKETK